MKRNLIMRCLMLTLGGALLVPLPAAATETQARAAGQTEPPRSHARPAAKLPRGFVYLDVVAPDIITEMRYATTKNFTGRRVSGYHANRCILARPVASALARVQAAVRKKGYTVKVYDCYRPVRAVRAFVRWAQSSRGHAETKFYYPRISRRRIIALGYIARQSSHSRGIAVDLTLVRPSSDGARQAPLAKRVGGAPVSCIAPRPEPAPASLNMGTNWDCFDVLSHTRHGEISATAKANRQRLVRAMLAKGFRNYKREWWHFSMPLRQYSRLRDFPVE